MTPSRVGVTGAGGFIGEALCRRLVADGHEVAGLDSDPSRAERVRAAGAEFRACDIRDRAATAAALADCPLVVHTAAIATDWGSWRLFESVNVGGTRNVLDAGAERVVHVSTVAIWGYEFEQDVPENEPPHPCGIPYIDTKGMAELLAQCHGATVVRPGDVYGPGSVQWAVRPFEMMKRGMLRVPGRGEGLMTPVYVDDLVDGLVRALTLPEAAGGTYTCWDGHAVTTREFFGHYSRMLGRDSTPTIPVPAMRAAATVYEAAARVTGKPPPLSSNAIAFLSRKAVYPNARAREELGWEPQVDLAEGMRRTEAWFREAGLLPQP